MSWGPIDSAVLRAIDERVFPGCVVACGQGRGGAAFERAYGRLTYAADAAEVRGDTLYDLASLTKPIATATLSMQAVDEGRLELDAPVSRSVPELAGGGRERITARQLLSHASGLPAWLPLFRDAASRRDVVERVVATPLQAAPGQRSVYSDLGFILLGEVLERSFGERLDGLARRRVLEPLGMHETGFRPAAGLLPRIAPTEQDSWRGRLVHGEVHDENAHAMDGVAPHAGLFGPAADLARFARSVLAGGACANGQALVRPATLALFTRRCDVPGSTRALGWDTPAEGSSAGSLLSPRSAGHTGFTGTSLWIDLERGLYVILLSNRVHPSRAPGRGPITAARRAVADAVVLALAV